MAALVAWDGGWGSIYQAVVEPFVCVTQRRIAARLHFCTVALDRLMATLLGRVLMLLQFSVPVYFFQKILSLPGVENLDLVVGNKIDVALWWTDSVQNTSVQRQWGISFECCVSGACGWGRHL